jgi:hypothetical protein
VEPDPHLQIVLRPIGSPLTVAMSGLAVASFVESGLALGWIAKSQALYVGLILIAVPFVLQALACVFAYLARDGATGAATGLLSTTWLALGLIHVVSRTSTINGAMGLLLVISAAALGLSSTVIASAKPLVGLVLGLAAARFALAGAYELSAVSFWQQAAGIVGLAVVAGTLYCVVAFELEEQDHRAVLPTFRRGRGREAVSGSLGARLDGATQEPGVRQMT